MPASVVRGGCSRTVGTAGGAGGGEEARTEEDRPAGDELHDAGLEERQGAGGVRREARRDRKHRVHAAEGARRRPEAASSRPLRTRRRGECHRNGPRT